ncbi:unnamed protein product [Ectocarpus sp. 6 AP-2014]
MGREHGRHAGYITATRTTLGPSKQYRHHGRLHERCH